MTATIIGIIASVLSGVVWWMTNRLPNKQEKRDADLLKEKQKVDDKIDTWANH